MSLGSRNNSLPSSTVVVRAHYCCELRDAPPSLVVSTPHTHIPHLHVPSLSYGTLKGPACWQVAWPISAPAHQPQICLTSKVLIQETDENIGSSRQTAAVKLTQITRPPWLVTLVNHDFSDHRSTLKSGTYTSDSNCFHIWLISQVVSEIYPMKMILKLSWASFPGRTWKEKERRQEESKGRREGRGWMENKAIGIRSSDLGVRKPETQSGFAYDS